MSGRERRIMAPTMAHVAERPLRVRCSSRLGAPVSCVHRAILRTSSSKQRSKVPQLSSKSKLKTTVGRVIHAFFLIAGIAHIGRDESSFKREDGAPGKGVSS